MTPATQLFMLTPLSEWYNTGYSTKNQTLFDLICDIAQVGEMESLTWEEVLHAEPPVTTPEYLKELCFDVWDDYFLRMEEILGNLDIDWDYAAKEYRKYIIKLCESQQDEAIDELARMEIEGREDFQRFKDEVNRIVQNPCLIGLNRLRQMRKYQEKEIKKHSKKLDYIKAQLKTTKR